MGVFWLILAKIVGEGWCDFWGIAIATATTPEPLLSKEGKSDSAEGIACPQRPQAGLRGGRATSLPLGAPRNDR